MSKHIRKYFLLSILTFLIYQYNSDSLQKLYRRLSLHFWPIKEKYSECKSLEYSVRKILSTSNNNWSITTLNNRGEIILSVNGYKNMIPASNQKILTTAFALDKLGPKYNLNTKLFFNKNKNIYEIIGQGDPDLNYNDIISISNTIKEHYYKNDLDELRVIIYEEPKDNWWNSTWSTQDKLEPYGAPITRLALTSNANDQSINDPLARFDYTLSLLLASDIKDFQIIRKNHSKFNNQNNNYPLLKIDSAPLYSLLSLANSESHNFTSEVLLRVSSGTWNQEDSIKQLENWYQTIRFPSESIITFDGSGLSRSNRMSTNSLAHLLYRMDKHRHRRYFISSMSLLGYRGTLKNLNTYPEINGRFLGKTGTLSGIRSLSGYLFKDNTVNYISIFTNSVLDVENKYQIILKEIFKNNECN